MPDSIQSFFHISLRYRNCLWSDYGVLWWTSTRPCCAKIVSDQTQRWDLRCTLIGFLSLVLEAAGSVVYFWEKSITVLSQMVWSDVAFVWRRKLSILKWITTQAKLQPPPSLRTDNLKTRSDSKVLPKSNAEKRDGTPSWGPRQKQACPDRPRRKVPMSRPSQTESAYVQTVPDGRCLCPDRPRRKVPMSRPSQTEGAYVQTVPDGRCLCPDVRA